jgi:trimeric autotransporter adhesin
MSQAGIVDIIGTHPQIPTLFVCNVGSAIPITNTLEILGEAVAAAGIPLQTVGSGNTVEIEVQYTSAAAISAASNAGVGSFNSSFFTVDSNGFVSVSGGAVLEKFTVDAHTAPGTNPVLADGSGNINVTGGQVAAGTTTNVIQTNSLAANTYTIQIQRSQAVASSTVGDNGVSHFNSTYFTVDGNGFVSVSGTGVLQTLTGNTGGAISPSSGNINTLGSGSITIAGSGNTLTTQLTGLTNHNVLVGAGTATITNVAPSATSGVPLVSNGSSSDPSFSTALIAGGGTASTSFNTTGVVITGATSTTALTAVTLTDGQLAIGSSAGNPAAATLSAGSGIAITNGHNSITISATSGGFAWSDQSGNFNAAKENGYFCTAALTATLPASPSEGDTIAFICTTTSIVIGANTGQTIKIGASSSTSAGTATNNAIGDSVTLVYRSTGTAWWSLTGPQGTWTLA